MNDEKKGSQQPSQGPDMSSTDLFGDDLSSDEDQVGSLFIEGQRLELGKIERIGYERCFFFG